MLQDVYTLIGDLWCGPPEADAQGVEIRRHGAALAKRLEAIDKESAGLLSRFLDEQEASQEDYVDLFELDPQCPLYLGSHSYDEPKTCAGAAVSDRNEYMIELVGIYRHFGRMPNGRELPDYLPLMVDFLAVTADAGDDPIRQKFVDDYFVPFMPPMRSRLEALKTPYLHLFDALQRIMEVERSTQTPATEAEPELEDDVG